MVPGSRLKFLSVDFVTARTIDDCHACLTRCAAETGQQIRLLADNSFSLQSAVSEANPVAIKFWGTLEPVRHGTWVWGTVIETGARRAGKLAYVLWFPAIVCLVVALQALLRGGWGSLFLGLLGAAGVGLVATGLWWRRHRHAMRVVNWVYEVLYVPPERPAPSPEPGGEI